MADPSLLQGGVAAAVAAGVVVLRVTAARRRAPKRPPMDPFTLTDPWRSYVADALSAATRFRRVVDGVEEGPLEERLREIGQQIEAGVLSCWSVAKHGHQLHKTVLQVARGTAADSDSVVRMRGTERETADKLGALVRSLDEAVARAGELAIGRAADQKLETDVDGVVDQLEALRLAVEEVSGVAEPPTT